MAGKPWPTPVGYVRSSEIVRIARMLSVLAPQEVRHPISSPTLYQWATDPPDLDKPHLPAYKNLPFPIEKKEIRRTRREGRRPNQRIILFYPKDKVFDIVVWHEIMMGQRIDDRAARARLLKKIYDEHLQRATA